MEHLEGVRFLDHLKRAFIDFFETILKKEIKEIIL